MNNKISLKNLSQKYSDRTGICPEESEAFIKIVFGKVVDELSNGNACEIPGLGSFNASANPDEPVIFTPCEEFATSVNAPFAIFEPEEIVGDGKIEDLEPEEDEMGNDEIEDKDEDKDNISTSIIEQDFSVVERPVSTDAETSICGNDMETIEHEPESDRSFSLEPECEIGNGDIVEECNISDTSDNNRTAEDASETECLPEDEEEVVEYTVVKSQFGIGFLIGLVCGLVIGALAFIGYMIYFVK